MTGAVDGATRRGRRRPRGRPLAGIGVVVVGVLIAGLLLSVLAQQIVRQDRLGHESLQERTTARLHLTNEYIGSYINDLMDQIRTHAELALTGPSPSTDDFTRVAVETRIERLVLLDDRGIALHVLPANPDVIGTNLAERYDHLRTAVGGNPAVSDVVPSAAEGVPIVAFAVPFDTPSGRRVLSGGIGLADTPLGMLLRRSSLIKTQEVFLVDGNDQVIAGSTPGVSGPIAELDAPLAETLEGDERASMVLEDGRTDRFVAGEVVGSTPWYIVTTVATAELYRPLGDRSAPWRLFGAFLLVSLLSVALITQVFSQRRGLHASVAQFATLTTTLRASEEKIRRVIDTAGDAYVAIDQGGVVIEWNDQAESLFGWSRGDAVGQPLVTLIIPEAFRAAHLAGIAHFLTTGEGPILDQQIELEAVRSDGTPVPVELSVWALETPAGWNFNALIRDISDRQTQQRALRDSEEERRLTQENAATGMALVAIDGHFLQANPALCAIVGRTAEDLARLKINDITHPEDLQIGHDDLGRLLDGDVTAYKIEKRYLRPDGSAIWVEAHVSLLRDEHGEPRRFIVQVLDIEQRRQHQDELTREVAVRRQAEEAARRERDFSSVLLASMHEGYLFTAGGVIIDVNDQLCALTGFSRADLVGRPQPWPFWPEEERENYVTVTRTVRDDGGGDLEVRYRRKSGETFPVALAVRSHDADGETPGYITIVSDLTEVRRREDVLIAAAALDPLTGLYNRRSIDGEMTNLRPHDAVILLDLDFFKQVNDTRGHAAGDEVLITLARCISETLRGKDWAGRLGGEEFVIVARDGDEPGAQAVVDRLRRRWDATRPLTTFSAGIAIHAFETTAAETLRRADQAMYRAKHNGRNRTEVAAMPDGAGRPV